MDKNYLPDGFYFEEKKVPKEIGIIVDMDFGDIVGNIKDLIKDANNDLHRQPSCRFVP